MVILDQLLDFRSDFRAFKSHHEQLATNATFVIPHGGQLHADGSRWLTHVALTCRTDADVLDLAQRFGDILGILLEPMGFCVAKIYLMFRGKTALVIWKHAPEASLQDFHHRSAVGSGQERHQSSRRRKEICLRYLRSHLPVFQREIWLATIMQSISERFYNWMEDLLMRLIRAVISEVVGVQILDALSASSPLRGTFVRSFSVNNSQRQPGLQTGASSSPSTVKPRKLTGLDYVMSTLSPALA